MHKIQLVQPDGSIWEYDIPEAEYEAIMQAVWHRILGAQEDAGFPPAKLVVEL